MDLNKLVELNYEKYLSYAKSIKNKNDDPYDILNETIVHLYDIPQSKLDKIGSGIDKFIYCIIWRNTYSKSSAYQRVIKGKRMLELKDVYRQEDDYVDDSIDYNLIKDILKEKCNMFEREVFLQYINKYKSFSKMYEDTNIPKPSLYKAYNSAVEKIIENYGKGEIQRNNRKRKSN